eukprot:scaffold419733_cov20-Prasinocladus_malaysianus.AAC.1
MQRASATTTENVYFGWPMGVSGVSLVIVVVVRHKKLLAVEHVLVRLGRRRVWVEAKFASWRWHRLHAQSSYN